MGSSARIDPAAGDLAKQLAKAEIAEKTQVGLAALIILPLVAHHACCVATKSASH
jgi:hypothetical protein